MDTHTIYNILKSVDATNQFLHGIYSIDEIPEQIETVPAIFLINTAKSFERGILLRLFAFEESI
jgi:hypothetical protein